RAALAHARQALAQLGGEPAVVARVRLELPIAAEPRGEPCHRAHFGGRFSRNAAMPSCPSSPARRRAISSQVSAATAAGSAAVTSRTSFFASAIAVGPPFLRSPTTPASAPSSSVGGATRSPSPP